MFLLLLLRIVKIGRARSGRTLEEKDLEFLILGSSNVSALDVWMEIFTLL